MLILICFSICINLLTEIASNNKLRYIGFYINLFKGVKIDKDKHLNKSSFKFLKTLFNIRSLLKRGSFSTIFYIN
jgi:hypothetical protein